MSRSKLFEYGHFEPKIIRLRLCWCLKYSLRYRALEEILHELGLAVDHTTIYRRLPLGPALLSSPGKEMLDQTQVGQQLLASGRDLRHPEGITVSSRGVCSQECGSRHLIRR